MRRMTAKFLLLCLLLTMLPVAALATETAQTVELTETVAEEVPVWAYNQCGPDLTWEMNGNTLTISGTGEMDHYPDGDAPWLEYKDNIEKLVFTGGVTSVGDCAFMDYDNLKEIDFGSAMHTIGYRAFKSCDGLTTFTLPASFRQFGAECFMGSSSLREIRCLGGMPSFKSSCLWDCPVSVFYPTTNPWPAEYVTPLFQSYQGKLQIFMGDGIEEAGEKITEPVETQPQATEPVQTIPETTVPETTEAELKAVTEPTETIPEETAAQTEAVQTEETTQATEEPEETPQQKRGGGLNGMLIGMILITGVLTLLLLGALLFHRRSY